MSDSVDAGQPPRTFGPVPSRRFGRSLGINTIPPKTCTYSCVYCQVGRTNRLTIERQRLCDPGELRADVAAALRHLQERRERVDYLTFVPDGEPTLDLGLGDQIRLLQPLGIPVAVITNASLLAAEDVRRELSAAERVSVKVDAVRYDTWRRIDRPHGRLLLEHVLEGILQFSRDFQGELDTETMLVEGLNDTDDDLRPLAAFLEQVNPARAYISIPIRPPAVEGVRPPSEEAIVRAYDRLSASVSRVELLTGHEGDDFAATGDARADLLSITAVHPMRDDQVEALLDRCGATWDVVEWLERQGYLAQIRYAGTTFIIRRMPNR